MPIVIFLASGAAAGAATCGAQAPNTSAASATQVIRISLIFIPFSFFLFDCLVPRLALCKSIELPAEDLLSLTGPPRTRQCRVSDCTIPYAEQVPQPGSSGP